MEAECVRCGCLSLISILYRTRRVAAPLRELCDTSMSIMRRLSKGRQIHGIQVHIGDPTRAPATALMNEGSRLGPDILQSKLGGLEKSRDRSRDQMVQGFLANRKGASHVRLPDRIITRPELQSKENVSFMLQYSGSLRLHLLRFVRRAALSAEEGMGFFIIC